MPTADPGVVIEDQWPGYVRYRRVDGYRWEVYGTCPQRGTCMVGAASTDIGWLPRSQRLDIPVLPGLTCDPCSELLIFVEL